jgi:hypothetical protein
LRQALVPGAQLSVQTPPTQRSPLAQTAPHVPQLPTSVSVSAQTLPPSVLQVMNPLAQVPAQVPAPLQVRPPEQGFAQVPQLFESSSRSAQYPPPSPPHAV